MTSMLPSLFYTLVLVGGLNWLVTGTRMVMDPPKCVAISNSTTQVVDMLEFAPVEVQLTVYFLVGASSIMLVFYNLFGGYWLTKGEAMIECFV